MEIENNRVPPAAAQNTGQGSQVENQVKAESAGVSAEPQAKISSSDKVTFTNTALRLQELEKLVASQPVVDTQRVNEIRNSIENGSFSINPERIADKLISLETALADAR